MCSALARHFEGLPRKNVSWRLQEEALRWRLQAGDYRKKTERELRRRRLLQSAVSGLRPEGADGCRLWSCLKAERRTGMRGISARFPISLSRVRVAGVTGATLPDRC